MRQRSQPLNGSLIRSLREGRGLTIADAAHTAGCSPRSWQGFEAGKPAFRSSIAAIAKVLDVDPSLLVVDTTFGLDADLQAFGTGSLGRAVLSLNRVHLRRSAAELLHAFCVALDNGGDSDAAWQLCLATVAVAPDFEMRVSARIRLAVIAHHQGNVDEGLSILRSVRRELRTRRLEASGLAHWASYQTGVLLLAAGRDAAAVRLLRDVERGAELSEQRTSARHQLGVAAMKHGRYHEAERLFRLCLADRPSNSYRRAFEYRRIAEACALGGRRSEAREALIAAHELVRKAGFLRYEREILKVARRLALRLDERKR